MAVGRDFLPKPNPNALLRIVIVASNINEKVSSIDSTCMSASSLLEATKIGTKAMFEVGIILKSNRKNSKPE